MSCLRAIASGATRLNEIAQRIGRSRSEEARPFLETLEEMALVERRYPVTRASKRKVHYAITDPFLRFWFRFVAPRESRLQLRADAERYLEDTVLPQLDKFVSEDAFERVCQGWLLRHLEAATETGRWWGPIRRREGGAPRSRMYESDVDPVEEVEVGAGRRQLAPDRLQLVELDGGVLVDAALAVRPLAGAERQHPPLLVDRVDFSPRLRQLEVERDDVRLVLASELVP